VVVKRFSISLDEELVQIFDRHISNKGYNNRSEAIRDLIREHLVEEEWADDSAETTGVAIIVYDHHQMELSQKLAHHQHQDYTSIVSNLHIHQDEYNCLEVIVLRGQARKIREIANTLISMRGVKHGRFFETTTGKYFP
jgi:CopG family nickel-responsive transcriptional regulator